MCLCKLRNILFPTNIIGLNKRSVSFAVAEGLSDVVLEIVWSGKRLECAYTTHFHGGEYQKTEYYTPHNETWKDGNEDEHTIAIRRKPNPFAINEIVGNKFYFNCTGVTSLVVNGQTLI